MISNILQLIVNVIIALAGIVGVYYTAKRAMKTQLTGAYFSEMTSAYAEYLKAIDAFVYHPEQSTRDDLSSSLHRLLLFAPMQICDFANELYIQVIDWNRGSRQSPLQIDVALNRLGDLMRTDLKYFRMHGDHE